MYIFSVYQPINFDRLHVDGTENHEFSLRNCPVFAITGVQIAQLFKPTTFIDFRFLRTSLVLLRDDKFNETFIFKSSSRKCVLLITSRIPSMHAIQYKMTMKIWIGYYYNTLCETRFGNKEICHAKQKLRTICS